RRGRTGRPGAAAASAAPQQGLDLARGLLALAYGLRRPAAIRLLEKTPENCLRLDFLAALLPDASVIFLTRDGRANVHSLMEGWRQPHLFAGYTVPEPVTIPGLARRRWAFTLIPGWRALRDRPLEEVCAWQWARCNQAVLDFAERTAGRVPLLTVRYEALVSQPEATLRTIAEFVGLDYAAELSRQAQALPEINVVSTPAAEKWRGRGREFVERIAAIIRPTMEKLGYDLEG
ncbi:MAG: sulfotransferase family protein, partial [Candidatus Promineifilaceae bacterium]